MALLDLQGMKAERTAADSALRNKNSGASKGCTIGGGGGGGSRLSLALC